MTTKELRRYRSQADQVLARLQRGPATNVELQRFALRFGARIYDLRQRGLRIATEPLENGVVQYRLLDG